MEGTFHTVSKQIREWIYKQPHVKEESLTDWLLYNISSKEKVIHYHTFTRNEESKNGSDWEWWVIEGKDYVNAYRFLVQAKKLLPNDEDNYPKFVYSNKNGFQIDLLLDSAKEKRALPLYMFYSNSEQDDNFVSSKSTFINQNIINWCSKCLNGSYLSLASDIYELVFNHKRRIITTKEILSHSYKLSLCDLLLSNSPFQSENKNVSIILSSFNQSIKDKHIGRIYNKNSVFSKNGIKYIESDIPNYVFKIIGNNNYNDISWIEKEYKAYLKNLDGIGIIDLRIC